MRRGKITVEQGQVLVVSVDLISSSRWHRVWYIDAHTKYYEVGGYGGREILLMANERTLKCDRDALWTRVTLPVPRGWEVCPETHARYSLQVVAYKPARRHCRGFWSRQAWQPTDTEYEEISKKAFPEGI